MTEHIDTERVDKRTNDTRQKVLEYVKSYWEANFYAPSYREIRDALGLHTTSVIVYHVNKLVESGDLTYEIGAKRSLRPTGMIVNVINKGSYERQSH